LEEKMNALIQKSFKNNEEMTANEQDKNIIYEDPFEEGHEDRSPCIMNRFCIHDDPVMCIAVDPRNNRQFITGGLDDKAVLWDLNKAIDSENIFSLDMKETVSLVGYNFDGSMVALGCLDETIRLFDTSTGKQAREIICPASEISTLNFHPKGNAILTSFKDGSIIIYSAKTGNEMAHFFGHTSEVYGAFFTPDAKHIVSIGGDKTLRKWDPIKNKEVGRLDDYKFHTDSVTNLVFHPTNSTTLVTGSLDGTFCLSGYGDKLQTFFRSKEFDAEVSCVSISDQHNCILAGVLDGTLSCLDIETLKTISNEKFDSGFINSKWWKERKINVLSTVNGELVLQGYGYGKSNIIGNIRVH